MSDQVTAQTATRADFTKQIRRLHWFLGMIANRPLEFNTACRALAQEALLEIQLVEPEGSALLWKDPLDQDARDKILRRDSVHGGNNLILPPRRGKGMDQTREEAQAGRTAQETANQGGGAAPLKEIEMLDVTSSNIARIGHDGEKTLRVEFRPPKGYVSGDSWDYDGITPGEFIELYQSNSVGSTYNAMTKNRNIKGVKVIEKKAAA